MAVEFEFDLYKRNTKTCNWEYGFFKLILWLVFLNYCEILKLQRNKKLSDAINSRNINLVKYLMSINSKHLQ